MTAFRKTLSLAIVSLFSFSGVFLLSPASFAQAPQPAPSNQVETIRNPVSSETFLGLALRIMKYLLGAIAGIAVVFIMFGAVELMVSRGNQELITRGKDTILWAVVGLAASLFAFSLVAILQNLLNKFFGANL